MSAILSGRAIARARKLTQALTSKSAIQQLTTTGGPNKRLPAHEYTCFEYLEQLELYQHEKPFQFTNPGADLAKGQRASNLMWKARMPQRITDMRGQEETFDLDKHGFAVRKWPTALSSDDFDQFDLVKHIYSPEIHNLIKNVVKGADYVIDVRCQVGCPGCAHIDDQADI